MQWDIWVAKRVSYERTIYNICIFQEPELCQTSANFIKIRRSPFLDSDAAEASTKRFLQGMTFC